MILDSKRRAAVVLATVALLPATLALTAAHGVTTETPYPYEGAGPYANMLAVGGPDQHVFTGYGSGKIVEHDDSGALLRTVTPASSSYMSGLQVDAAGNLYINHGSRVRKVSPTGTELWAFDLPETDRRQGLSLRGDTLWMTAYNPYDPVTAVVAVDASTGAEVHRFSLANAWNVEALPNGNVLVSQQGGTTELTPTGDYVRTAPSYGSAYTATASGNVVGVLNTAPLGSPSNSSLRMWTPSGQSTLGHALGTRTVSDVAVAPSGVVWAITSGNNAYSLLKVDPRTPDVALTTSGPNAQTGTPVTLDASGSFVPFAAPSRYEWDLDGNGSFETDSGATGQISTTYDTAGVRNVRVRVSSPAGGSAVTGAAIDVSTASPVGPVGVSVNNGATYTNDPEVTVSMRWPTYAKDLVISNDGGFFPASQHAVTPSITWTLDSSGPERLPKTIYVRFMGGQAGAETYQDDIILDQTRPVVASATGSTGTSPRVAARLGAKKTYKLVLKATDATSGVSRMQVTYQKSKPGTWKTFAKKVKIKSPTPKIFVRVMDRAGNVSGWKRIKVL